MIEELVIAGGVIIAIGVAIFIFVCTFAEKLFRGANENHCTIPLVMLVTSSVCAVFSIVGTALLIAGLAVERN